MGNEPTCPYEEGHIIKDCPIQLAYEEQKARAEKAEAKVESVRAFICSFYPERESERVNKLIERVDDILEARKNGK